MRSIIFLAVALIGNTLIADERDDLIKQLRLEIYTLKAEILLLKQPVIESKIVMESIANCDSCDRWFTGAEPVQLQAVGWKVDRVKVQPRAGKLYPRWRVCIGDACQEIENTRSIMPRLREIVDRHQRQRWELFQ